MQMNSILLGKAGQKVQITLDGTKVAIIKNNNPFIDYLYISDNNTPDRYDVRLKYGEQMTVSSNIFIYHLNPEIKGRIKFFYRITTQPDKILKDFSISGSGSGSNKMTILEMAEEQRIPNDRWTVIEALTENRNTNKDWITHGIFDVREKGYYNIKLTTKIERMGDSRNKMAIRLIDERDNIIADVSSSQQDSHILPSLSLDKVAFFEEEQRIRFEFYQNSGDDIQILGKPFSTFGSIELLNIEE